MTFENLVIGQFNELAFKAANEICERPGEKYPLMVIYGELATGKSALLQAMESKLQKNNSVLLYTGINFLKNYIESVKTHNTFGFEKKFLEVDVLIIDDLQDLRNKLQTQGILSRLLKERLLNKKQSILSSSTLIQQIEDIDPRLTDIISEGLSVRIHNPSFEDRLFMVKHYALAIEISLYDDVAVFLAEHCRNGLREIIGSLIKLKAASELLEIEINLEMVKKYLEKDYHEKNNN